MKNLNLKSIVSILFVGLLLSSCESSSEGEEGHGEHGDEKSVSLTEAQTKAIELKLVNIEQRNMNIGIEVTGRLDLPPQDKADVSPLMGGIVKKIYVIEGDKVRKGQVLAIMQHPDFIQLQEDYINSINNLEFLEKEYLRTKKLYEEKVTSGTAFQKITAEYKNNQAQLNTQKIKLNMLGLNVNKIAEGTIFPVVSITSPLNGTVSLVETNVGSFAEPMSKLFEIVDNSELHADFRVFEKDINKVALGQKVFFMTSSVHDEEFESEIHAISPVFEENPRALHVHAEISNSKSNLISGMYIKGRIVAENVMTSVLPEHAIVSEEDKFYIFVKTKDEEHNDSADEHDHDKSEAEATPDEHGHDDHDQKKLTFEMVEVMTGYSSGGYIEVKLLTPLPKDAEIAGNGAYYLLAEMGKGETEHEH
tara:strand:+ start:8428 stop:9687 length:1260 start_codon:yes stop_codon:yes gene_type:complete